MSDKLQLIYDVLRMKKYALVATISAVVLGIIYYFLSMAMLPAHLGIAMESMPYYTVASIGLTIVISALAGINFALMAFKIKKMKLIRSVKSNSSAVLGGAFAAFTPGCPACTAPLAVILGAVGGLAVFPMQGLELKFISAGVLIFSIYWITRGLQRHDCCSVK